MHPPPGRQSGGGEAVPARLQCDNLSLYKRQPKRVGVTDLDLAANYHLSVGLPSGPVPAATSGPVFLISRPQLCSISYIFPG